MRRKKEERERIREEMQIEEFDEVQKRKKINERKLSYENEEKVCLEE